MTESLDWLAFGPHPDDVELFCGGTLIGAARRGQRVGVVDLTEGERATNGDVETRQAEARAAAEVMNLATRDNLGLPDGELSAHLGGALRKEALGRLVEVLRRLRPELVVAPWSEARHPDHSAASALVTEAVFVAGLKKYEDGQPTHRPRRLVYYPMRHRCRPSFVVDITKDADAKWAAIACHESQVGPAAADTLIGSSDAVEAIRARDRHYGSTIGTTYGEPFRMAETLALSDPLGHFRNHDFGPIHFFEDTQ